ncbi:MAG: hypothetical protein FJY75_01705 [Candidatus Eisenbacteria bacterium]|uniref:T9SS type A sorting domain-containing protein n=1 Tax=Eiseniibacteriota bacterium TaxID=2212470 RepID=A0A938BPT1_UNCEI|nr:hypothetical protein [Candidatus Eisenbacteria bacterium]
MQRTVLALVLLLCVPGAGAEELTFTTWNLLNYPGGDGLARAPHFRTVLTQVAPDILVVQEIQTETGVAHFLTHVLGQIEPGAWTSGPFHNGYDTDRALFIRAGCVEVVASGWLSTALRTIDWWHLYWPATGEEFRVYTLHLKASQGYEQQRLAECTILRTALAGLDEGLPFLVAGDYNIYTATEPAYQHLTAEGPGRLFDPIDQEGHWHDNPAYAAIHTQSTRTTSFGGGATGGMDDRFDLILVAAELLDGSGLEILPDTYTAFGNDGAHFNQSIIENGNAAVPYEVAEALHLSSDHLPVFALLRAGPTADLVWLPPSTRLSVGPNPASGPTTLRFTLGSSDPAALGIYDAAGRLVGRWPGAGRAGTHEWVWNGGGADGRPAGPGVYYARLAGGGGTSVARIVRIGD